MPQEDATAVLAATHADGRDALDAVFPLVYAELRRMAHAALAREDGPRTLDTNALVHEAYLRMVDSTRVSERGRGYFFAAAARAMRQVLVDSARRRRAKKRTAGEQRVTLETDTVAVDAFADEIVDIDRMPARLAASPVHEATFGADNMNVAGTLMNLAEARRRLGEVEGVEELLRRGLAIMEQTLGPDHASIATAHDSIGRFLADQQRYDEAIAAHRNAIEVYSRALAADHPYVAYPLGSLGNIEHARGRPADAIPYFEQALAIREQAFGPEHPDVASSLASIGSARFDADQLEAAQAPIARALAIRRATLPPEHPSVADSLVLLARLEIERGDCAARSSARRGSRAP